MIENMPLISIVMPVYNAGIYLKDAIHDILFQTYNNFELICVNDGSTDQSEDILGFFAKKDKRINIFKQENKGAGVARNVGIELAHGEYIIFLDSDDRFKRNFLSEMVNEAVTTSAQVVVCDAYKFDSTKGYILEDNEKEWILRKDFHPRTDVFSASEYADQIFRFASVVPWNKLYNLSYIRKAGILFEDVPYGNDIYFVAMTLALADRVRIINKKLLYYRINNNTAVSWYKNKQTNPKYGFETIYLIRNKLIELNLYDNFRKGLSIFAAYYLCFFQWNVTEENYSIFKEYLDSDSIYKKCLLELTEKDIEDKIVFDDIRALCEGGVVKYFARIIHRLSDLNGYLSSLEAGYNQGDIKRKRLFDIPGIPEQSKIVIFGAGYRGKALYNANKEEEKYKIIAWLDTKADEINSIEIKIEYPEAIKNIEYDYVIIAVDDFRVMMEIRDTLKKLGVKEDKIVW